MEIYTGRNQIMKLKASLYKKAKYSWKYVRRTTALRTGIQEKTVQVKSKIEAGDMSTYCMMIPRVVETTSPIRCEEKKYRKIKYSQNYKNKQSTAIKELPLQEVRNGEKPL